MEILMSRAVAEKLNLISWINPVIWDSDIYVSVRSVDTSLVKFRFKVVTDTTIERAPYSSNSVFTDTQKSTSNLWDMQTEYKAYCKQTFGLDQIKTFKRFMHARIEKQNIRKFNNISLTFLKPLQCTFHEFEVHLHLGAFNVRKSIMIVVGNDILDVFLNIYFSLASFNGIFWRLQYLQILFIVGIGGLRWRPIWFASPYSVTTGLVTTGHIIFTIIFTINITITSIIIIIMVTQPLPPLPQPPLPPPPPSLPSPS